MTEEEFLENLWYELYDNHRIEDPGSGHLWIYSVVLRHILSGIDPRTTAKDIIFSLERRIKELEENK